MKHRQFINSAVLEDNVGKIELWGDVYENQPIDWWTGEPVPGNFITVQKFQEAMERVKNCSKIELHLNSYGGDATVGILIHNLLKASGKKITCIIDAIAASAAFTIASACDEVLVYPGSIMMCHEVRSLVWGFLSNDELQEVMNGNTAYNNSAAAMYAKKSGMSKQQCLNLMNKTTWMDAEQAVKYGFANGIIDVDEEKEQPVALVNKNTMKVNGQEYDVSNLHIPDEFIQHIQNKGQTGGKVMSKESLQDKLINAITSIFKNDAEIEEEGKDNGQNGEASEGAEENTAAQAEGESNANEEGQAGQNDENSEEGQSEGGNSEEGIENKVENAVKAERERIASIHKMSNGIDSDLIEEAMFGETACDAAELALRAKEREDAKQSKSLENLKKDSAESNANDVSAKPGEIAADTLKEADEREAAVKVLREKLSKGGK